MRYIILMLSLLAAAGTAHAQAQNPAPVQQMHTAPVPADAPEEPNMKILRDSGGAAKSSLVKRAPLSDDFVLGNRQAPLIMIEYASMSCPHCAHFSGTVLPELEKKYIQTGKMMYILRQFPLNDPALKAAMLLECVGNQNNDKYYVFARVMFDAQNKWAFDGNYVSGLETIAAVGGVSREQFKNCVNNTDREMRVLKIKKAATEELKIPHTPYFFIGGEVYSGDRTVEDVSRFIDSKLALAKSQPRDVIDAITNTVR